MNLLASFEKETRESASNSSGLWGKLDRGRAGEWFGDSMLAMIARALYFQRCLKVKPVAEIEGSKFTVHRLRVALG